jgi:RNA polymerase sigma factor (sigma-70 family)
MAHETAVALSQMHGRFLGFLRGRLSDPSAAEDILQAAYVKAIEHGAELRETESSVAWFYRILRNAITDHYRQNSARSRAMDQFLSGWKDGYEPELKEQTCDCIREVIRDLKPEYRAAIEEIDLAERSVESFAAAQKTTSNNACVRLHRARKAVAKKLTEVCGTCAAHLCIDCSCKHPTP